MVQPAGTYAPYSSKKRKASSARQGYSSVPRTVGWVGKGEMKYFDTALELQAISAVTTTWGAGTIVDPAATINLGDATVATPLTLCVPKVSASLNGRIGREIKVHKIKIRGFVNVPPQAAQAAADTSATIRLVLVQDMQTNASQMTSAQLFNDTYAGGSINTTIHSFQNPNNFGRFRVLKDKFIVISNANLAGSPTAADVVQQGLQRHFQFSIKFKKPVPVRFNATNGGTVADIVDNSFHIVCGTTNTNYAQTLSYYCRCAYKE